MLGWEDLLGQIREKIKAAPLPQNNFANRGNGDISKNLHTSAWREMNYLIKFVIHVSPMTFYIYKLPNCVSSPSLRVFDADILCKRNSRLRIVPIACIPFFPWSNTAPLWNLVLEGAGTDVSHRSKIFIQEKERTLYTRSEIANWASLK